MARPYFYPPFHEGWTYAGATYAGHSDYSVDWNRRTPGGGWIDDTGDPVLASAAGIVDQVEISNGFVMLAHGAGLMTEYRHMSGITVQVGDAVLRGTRIGSIGNVAGDGASFGAHLHSVHWRYGKRIKMRYLGIPIASSVWNSDTKPVGWVPPEPVMVVGPARSLGVKELRAYLQRIRTLADKALT